MNQRLAGWMLGMGMALGPILGWAGANPNLPFYGGGGTITANPAYPIVGETTHIEVIVGNNGDAPATNVRVKVSINDWGVTFNGWQEVGTVTLASIPVGGTAVAAVDHVFASAVHTCVEAIIIGADEDADPNDDRGQINLEVIHAGDSFSYQVPIRNEGDVPLQLAIRGGCPGKDAAGQVIDPCKLIDAKAEVKPGTEILVPVEVDLRAVPAGGVVDFVVDAFDQAGNHNHVVLRVVHSSAKALKAEAAAVADDLSDEMPNRGLRERVENLAKHIRLALAPRLWRDDNHLREHGGAMVFAQELTAVQLALDLLDAKLPLAAKVKLDGLVRKLVDADRILAKAALAGSGDLEEDEALEAAEWIQDGDDARERGRYRRAVQAYAHAWRDAIH